MTAMRVDASPGGCLRQPDRHTFTFSILWASHNLCTSHNFGGLRAKPALGFAPVFPALHLEGFACPPRVFEEPMSAPFIVPTFTKWPPVQAQSATVSGSWQAATDSCTAATSSADGAEARRSQVGRRERRIFLNQGTRLPLFLMERVTPNASCC